MPTVNEQLFDLMVRHQIGLRRLGTGQSQRLLVILNNHDLVILRALASVSEDTTARQVEGVLKSVQRLNTEAYQEIEVSLVKEMEDTANYEVGFQGAAIAAVLTAPILVGLGLTGPSQKDIVKLVSNTASNGAKLSEYIAGAALGRFNRIRDAVRRVHQAGTDVQSNIRKVIVGTRIANFMDGVFGSARRSIEQIVRIVQSGIVHAVRNFLYGHNDHIIKGMLWISVLDSRTTDICRMLDGSVFPLDEGPRPPVHFNCRSTIAPIIPNWRELGLGADEVEGMSNLISGDIPPRLTYNEWLAKQPVSVQDEVLGPTRGKLYRSGEVSLDKFVDERGRRYTLKELAKREGITI